MGVKERLVELGKSPPDLKQFRDAARIRESERREGIRTNQSALLEELRAGGVVGFYEEFLGEEIPSLEEHRQGYDEWRNSWLKDLGEGNSTIPESDIGKWRLFIPGPKQWEDGRWDTALHVNLIRYRDKSYIDWDQVQLTYDGNFIVITGELVTFEGFVNKETIRSKLLGLEQALTEAIFTPLWLRR